MKENLSLLAISLIATCIILTIITLLLVLIINKWEKKSKIKSEKNTNMGTASSGYVSQSNESSHSNHDFQTGFILGNIFEGMNNHHSSNSHDSFSGGDFGGGGSGDDW